MTHLLDLRRVLSSSKVSLLCFNPARDRMLGRDFGKPEDMPPETREDLRAIWDLTKDYWQVTTWVNDDRNGNAFFFKDQGDTDWDRIQQLLDMSDDEMAARFDKWHNQEGDSEEDDTGDEDGEENETVSKEDGGNEEND